MTGIWNLEDAKYVKSTTTDNKNNECGNCSKSVRLSNTRGAACYRGFRWGCMEFIDVVIVASILIAPSIALLVALLDGQFRWAYLTGNDKAFGYTHVQGGYLDLTWDLYKVFYDFDVSYFMYGVVIVMVFICLNVVEMFVVPALYPLR